MFICETCQDKTLVPAVVRGKPDTIPCPHCHWLIEQEYTLDDEPLDVEDFIRVNMEDDALTEAQITAIKELAVGQELVIPSPGGDVDKFMLKRII